MSETKNRTIGRSFRINEQWLKTLDEEAERQRTTSNALINGILRDYCLFYRYFKRVDGISLSQKTLSRYAEACPKEKLDEIAKKAGSNVAIDLFRTMGLGFNFKDSIFFIVVILGEYADWFKCEHYIVKDREILHLRHNLGENWSFYISEVVSTLLERCCNRKVKREILDGAVTLEVPLT
ncbi:MAG: hypothetical protein ABSD92_13870 [Candidatus Bathyarchaeia archaeon]|jgi:hypothetical protein